MSSEKMKMRRCKGIRPTMQTDMNSERMQSNELKLKGSELLRPKLNAALKGTVVLNESGRTIKV